MGGPFRFGLIGVGRSGKVYIRTVLSLGDRCRVSHIGTSSTANASLLPYPVTVTGDWRVVVRSDCDGVIIATPPHTHAEILEACLQAGKPVIVEKPLCLDVRTAERVHVRAEAAGVPVLVNHTLLFDPGYQRLKEVLRTGGEAIRVILSEGAALGPFRADTPALWDWCAHDFSLCLDLLREVPLEVAALGGPVNLRGQPDLVSIRLGFPNGACAWIQSGRLSPERRRNLNVFTDQHLYMLDMARHGSSERLTVCSFPFSSRDEAPAAAVGDRRAIVVFSDRSPMMNVITYFLDVLDGANRHLLGTALGLEVVKLLASCAGVLK